MKIGVMLESFRQGLRGGIEAAAHLGVDGIQIYATQGETHFARLRGAGRRELQTMLADSGLEVSAVCGDFGGHGFEIAAENRRRIDNSMRIVELALELNCRIITTHIGVIPSNPAHPRRAIMRAACAELGDFAGKLDAVFAIETGPEPATVLRGFLDDLALPGGIGVNFDPANLMMVFREDIPAAVSTLAPYIVHTHAKDGRNRKPVDPELLYSSFAGDQLPPGFKSADYIEETPLGEGDVPFPAYLSALQRAHFDGYLTIEREVGANPTNDITHAIRFLRNLKFSKLVAPE